MTNLCKPNELIIAITFSQHKDIHKYTREVKTRNERSVVDYVLTNKRNKTHVRDVRIRRRAELCSDHYLLRARMRMKSGRERKSMHIRGEG